MTLEVALCPWALAPALIVIGPARSLRLLGWFATPLPQLHALPRLVICPARRKRPIVAAGRLSMLVTPVELSAWIP